LNPAVLNLYDAGTGSPVGNQVTLSGPTGALAATSAVNVTGGQVTVVAMDTGEWATEPAQKKMESMLNAHPNLAGVFCACLTAVIYQKLLGRPEGVAPPLKPRSRWVGPGDGRRPFSACSGQRTAPRSATP
jgi:hypothetical protein